MTSLSSKLGLLASWALVVAGLHGCTPSETVSPQCREMCSQLPASTYGEIRACEKKCMDPSGVYQPNEKNDSDGPSTSFF